jgi:hypothetical protein
MLDAETELEYVPAEHEVGNALDEGHQCPGKQGRQLIGNAEPIMVENVPGGHELHVLILFDPIAVEYRPAGHNDGVVVPKFGQYVPAGQGRQAPFVDWRSIVEYVPGEQAAGRKLAV